MSVFIQQLVQLVEWFLFAISVDNRRKTRRMDNNQVKDFSVFNQPDDQNYQRLTPQLALATFQYLSTSKYQINSAQSTSLPVSTRCNSALSTSLPASNR